MIQVNSQRPFVSIDGMKYVMDWKRALMAEILLKANGKLVHMHKLVSLLETTQKSVYVYADGLKKIFSQHNYALTNEKGHGYRLNKAMAIEFASAPLVVRECAA